MKNIKAILFDFDGVIIDSSVDCIREIIGVSKKLHLRVPRYEFIRKLWGVPYENVLKTIKNRYCWSDADLKKYYLNCDLHKTERRLFPGTETMLFNLKEHDMFLAIISSRTRQSLNSKLEKNQIRKYFDYIQGFEDCEFHKSSAEVFSDAINIFRNFWSQNDNIVFVGDTLVDLEAANNAKLPFIGITSGAVRKKEFMLAGLSEELILDDPIQIQDLVL